MKKYIILLTLVIWTALSSCNLLVKCTINKKYPPLPVNRIRDSTLRIALQMNELRQPDVGLTVKDSLSNAVIKDQLEKELEKYPNLDIDLVEKIDLNCMQLTSQKQSMIVDVNSTFYFNQKDKLKSIKYVRADVEGFLFPSFDNDSKVLHWNPAISRVHIQKIRFRNFFLRLFGPPVKLLLNNVLDLTKENINQVASRAKLDIVDSIYCKVAISDIIKSNDIKIIQDDTLDLKVFFNDPRILLDSNRLALVVDADAEKHAQLIKPEITYWLNEDVIDVLYRRYVALFNGVWANSFSGLSTHQNTTALKTSKLELLVDNVIGSKKFSFEFAIKKVKVLDKKHISIVNEFNCRAYLTQLFNCARVWEDGICLVAPWVCEARAAACLADLGMTILKCNNITDGLVPFLNDIGTVGGELGVQAAPLCSVSNIHLNTGRLSLFANVFTNDARATAHFSFTPDISLPGLLICQIPVSPHFSERVSANQNLTPLGNYAIEVAEPGKFGFKINSEPMALDLHFSPPLYLALLSRPQLFVGCSIGPAIIVASALAIGATPILCSISPNGKPCAYSQMAFDGFLNDLYRLEIKAQDKNLPFSIPKYSVTGKKVDYVLIKTNTYLAAQHFFNADPLAK